MHYRTLYEEGGQLRRDLLHNIAEHFFHDLNDMLIQHLVLQICKLTDPAKSLGHRNLTVKFIIEHLDSRVTPAEQATLRGLSDRMHAFRAEIEPARNKFISHLDHESLLIGKNLGAADTDLWLQFWLDLQDFLEIVYRCYVGQSHFHLNGIGLITDADSLVRALRQSTYFDEIMNDGRFTLQAADIADASRFAGA
jgi:hypothetical protein